MKRFWLLVAGVWWLVAALSVGAQELVVVLKNGEKIYGSLLPSKEQGKVLLKRGDDTLRIARAELQRAYLDLKPQHENESNRLRIFGGYKPSFWNRFGAALGMSNEGGAAFFSYALSGQNPRRDKRFGDFQKGARDESVGIISHIKCFSFAIAYHKLGIGPYLGMTYSDTEAFHLYNRIDGRGRFDGQYIIRESSRDQEKIGALIGFMTSPRLPVYVQVDYNTALKRTNVGIGASIKLPKI